MLTLLLWHASRIATRPERVAGRAGRRSRTRSRTSSATGTTTEVLERVFVWAHLLLVARLPRLPAALEAPPHRDRGDQRLVRPHPRARAARAARLHGRGRGRDALRLRHDRRHDVEADGRHDVVHRVRPLPGRLPRLRDRQGAVAEAPDHGAARPALRRGPEPARAIRAGFEPSPLVPNAVSDDVVWDCVTCGACVQRVPGRDRARRPHRRPAPPPRHGRGPLPGRGRDDAARRRARPEPVGEAADRARRLDGGARRARPAARRAAARGPLLGRLRGVVRRARPRRRRSRRRSCCRRRASTSRSSARASAAPATRPGGWATSTRSSRTPSRTSRR